jgi:nucleoside-diphosphate-sugar epimerase
MKHVILGSGPVGLSTAVALTARDCDVLVVSRRRPPDLPSHIRHVAIDVRNDSALRSAVGRVSVVYQCLNAPYHRWPTDFPPLQAAAVDFASRAEAKLVSFENLYPYGPPRQAPFAEGDAFAPCSDKGRVRALLANALTALHHAGGLEVAQVRASDLFGPGVLASALGEELIGRACAGKRPRVLGDPDAPHTWTFVSDAGETLARVGTRADTFGRVWHVPSAPACSQRQVVNTLETLLGTKLELRKTPPFALRLVGLFKPAAGALVEMLYEFAHPFVMDDAATRRALGQSHTPFDVALASTLSAFSHSEQHPCVQSSCP